MALKSRVRSKSLGGSATHKNTADFLKSQYPQELSISTEWPLAQQDEVQNLWANVPMQGTSFRTSPGTGGIVHHINFGLQIQGSPKESLICYLYNHNAEGIGTSGGRPVEPPIAESYPVLPSVVGAMGWVEFHFPSRPELANDSNFVATVWWPYGDPSNRFQIASDATPGYNGAQMQQNSSLTWFTVTSRDIPFQVWMEV